MPSLARCLRVCAVLLIAVPTLADLADPADPADLAVELLRTVDGGDDVMLYRPAAVAFGLDGHRYVLNAGDCRVLQFDADWTLVRTFGRQGEGPGEFTEPRGMLLRGDELWVFDVLRANVFSHEGEYLRTLASRLEMHSPLETDRGLLVRLGSSDRLAALLDDELGLVSKLGPACPDDGDFMREYRACGFVHALPHPDYLAVLINPFDGHLWALDAGGAVARELDLAEDQGLSSLNAPDDDGRVVMRFTLVVAPGGIDRAGRLWTTAIDPDAAQPAADGPQRLQVRGRDLAPAATVTLPDGVAGYRVYHDPDGTLVLLDEQASLLHVCTYPEGLDGP